MDRSADSNQRANRLKKRTSLNTCALHRVIHAPLWKKWPEYVLYSNMSLFIMSELILARTSGEYISPGLFSMGRGK